MFDIKIQTDAKTKLKRIPATAYAVYHTAFPE